MALTAEADCAAVLHAARMDTRIGNVALRQLDDEIAGTLVALAQERSEPTAAALAAIHGRFKQNAAGHRVVCRMRPDAASSGGKGHRGGGTGGGGEIVVGLCHRGGEDAHIDVARGRQVVRCPQGGAMWRALHPPTPRICSRWAGKGEEATMRDVLLRFGEQCATAQGLDFPGPLQIQGVVEVWRLGNGCVRGPTTTTCTCLPRRHHDPFVECRIGRCSMHGLHLYGVVPMHPSLLRFGGRHACGGRWCEFGVSVWFDRVSSWRHMAHGEFVAQVLGCCCSPPVQRSLSIGHSARPAAPCPYCRLFSVT